MECGYIQIIPIWVAVLTDNIELLEENLFSLIVINWCIESKNILAVILIIKVEQQRKNTETSLPLRLLVGRLWQYLYLIV